MRMTLLIASVVVAVGIVAALAGGVADKTESRPASINSIVWKLAADGEFSQDDAQVVAKEAARRMWWPGSERIKLRSVTEDKGTFTVTVWDGIERPASPSCRVVVSRHWVSSVTFIPGE